MKQGRYAKIIQQGAAVYLGMFLLLGHTFPHITLILQLPFSSTL